MRWFIISALIVLAGCGPSQEELEAQQRAEAAAAEALAREQAERTAQVTCAIMAETRNMDAAQRVTQVNDVREELGLPPYLSGDDEIKRAFEFGTCEILVLDLNWKEVTDRLEDEYLAEQRRLAAEQARLAEEQRAREEAERQERLAAISAAVEARGYAIFNDEAERRGETMYLKGTGTRYTGEVRSFRDGTLSNRWNFENGKEHGLIEVFYSDGTLNFEWCYENAERVGGRDGRPACLRRGLPIYVPSLSRYVSGGEAGYPTK